MEPEVQLSWTEWEQRCREVDKPALHYAVKQQRIDVVRECLETYSTDINVVADYYGRDRMSHEYTPLHVAAESRSDSVEMVELLIRHGANVNATSKDGEIPLHCALSFMNENIIRFLVQNGADVNAEYRPDENNTPLMMLIRPTHKCEKDCPESVKLFAFFGALFNGADANVCAVCGKRVDGKVSVELVQLLIEHQADVNAVNTNGESPLHLAAQTQNSSITETCQLLINSGASVDAESYSGSKPLHCAALYAGTNEEVVDSLLECGALVNATDNIGRTPLHNAFYYDNLFPPPHHSFAVGCIESLLAHGANINAQDIYGQTPLHIAISCGIVKASAALLDHGADVTLKDQYCNTPLHYVFTRKFHELLDNYIPLYESHSLRNALGVSATAHLLLHSKRRPVSMSEKESLKKQCIDKFGNTLLHRLAIRARPTLAEPPYCLPEPVNFYGIVGDMKTQNDFGHTPLYLMKELEQALPFVDGTENNVKDYRGRNIYHIRRIISTNCVDDVDNLGRLQTHYAAIDGSYPLQDNNSEIKFQITDIFGRTPLYYALVWHDGLCTEPVKQLVETLKTSPNCANISSISDNMDVTISSYFRFEQEIKEWRTNLLKQMQDSYLLSYNKSTSTKILHLSKQELGLLMSSETSESREVVQELTEIYDAETAIWNMYHLSRFKPYGLSKEIIYYREVPQTPPQSELVPTAITQAVCEAMNFLAAHIEEIDPNLKCSVTLVGSTADGTKVGLCDEFDFTFVLTHLSNICEVCYSPESPPGYVQLKVQPGAQFDEDCLCDDRILDTRAISYLFHAVAAQVLDTEEFLSETGLEWKDSAMRREQILFGVTPSYEKMGNPMVFTARLMFNKCILGHAVLHEIKVDIVPAIQIKGWWPDEALQNVDSNVRDCGCHLVFSQPQKNFPWLGWTKPHAMISFALAETVCIRNSPPVVKAAQMVVKCICETLKSKHATDFRYSKKTILLPTSYVIKTAVMYCMADEVFTKCGLSEDQEIDKAELLRWVQNITRRLLCFAVQDFVPSYFLPAALSKVWQCEDHIKHFHWDMQKVVKRIRSAEPHISNSVENFDRAYMQSHHLYWSFLPADAERKLFLPPSMNLLCENSCWHLFTQ